MSLRAKLVATIFFGVALAAVGVAGSLLWLERGDPGGRLEERRAALARFAAEMAREARIAEDPMMLSSHLRAVVEREEAVASARFFWDGRWIGVAEGDSDWPRSETVDGVVVELGFSRAVLLRAETLRRKKSLHSAGLVLAIAFLLAFPLAWGLAGRFTGPLEELVAAIDRVAEGESHEPLPARRRDEIGRVASRFNRMTERLKQADAMKDAFVRAVSHDLKAPLSAIESYARRIAEDSGLDAKARENAGHVETNAARLREYIVQLLEEARIERGMLDIAPERFDLAETVRDTVVFFGPRAKEADMRLSFELDEQSIFVTADPERIQQVLGNLVGNALKFTRAGGTITVYAKRREDEGVIEAGVIDTGVGIAVEDQKRLFKRFERVKNPLKAGGSGLGLSIVKGIIEGHGGTVGLESTPGTGSRFYFLLPVRKGA